MGTGAKIRVGASVGGPAGVDADGVGLDIAILQSLQSVIGIKGQIQRLTNGVVYDDVGKCRVLVCRYTFVPLNLHKLGQGNADLVNFGALLLLCQQRRLLRGHEPVPIRVGLWLAKGSGKVVRKDTADDE